MNLESLMQDIRYFIDDEKEYDSVKANENGVLDYLNSLDETDIRDIANEILNDDYFIQQLMNEINDYVYHHRKWLKED